MWLIDTSSHDSQQRESISIFAIMINKTRFSVWNEQRWLHFVQGERLEPFPGLGCAVTCVFGQLLSPTCAWVSSLNFSTSHKAIGRSQVSPTVIKKQRYDFRSELLGSTSEASEVINVWGGGIPSIIHKLSWVWHRLIYKTDWNIGMNFAAFGNPLWNFRREHNDLLLNLLPSAAFSLLNTLAQVPSICNSHTKVCVGWTTWN